MGNTANEGTGTNAAGSTYGYTAPYGYISKAPKPGENIGEKIKEIGDALSFIDERLTTIGKEKKEYHQYGNSAKVRELDEAYRDYDNLRSMHRADLDAYQREYNKRNAAMSPAVPQNTVDTSWLSAGLKAPRARTLPL